MQSSSLLETSPFQGVLFLEVIGTNQWKVILLRMTFYGCFFSVIMLFSHMLNAKEYEKQFKLV